MMTNETFLKTTGVWAERELVDFTFQALYFIVSWGWQRIVSAAVWKKGKKEKSTNPHWYFQSLLSLTRKKSDKAKS